MYALTDLPIRLECKTSKHFKYYEFHVEQSGNGNVKVIGLYGRIGNAPQNHTIYHGTSPMEAEHHLTKKINNKLDKGYERAGNPPKPEPTAPEYVTVIKVEADDDPLFDGEMEVATTTKRTHRPAKKGTKVLTGFDASGSMNGILDVDGPLVPMNAQGVEDDEQLQNFLDDPRFYMEEKLDGMRALVYFTRTGLRIFSRTKKEKTISLPHLSGLVFPNLIGTILDAEIMVPGKDCAEIAGQVHRKNGVASTLPVIFLFDILQHNGKLVTGLKWAERRKLLVKVWEDDGLFGSEFFELNPVYVRAEKRKALKRIMDAGGEGVMFKLDSATYHVGDRPTGVWYKHKRKKAFDCVVMGFTTGKGEFNNMVGAVRFGQYVDGKLVELGKASGMDLDTRQDMTQCPDAWIGKAIKIEGQERLKSGKIRHPQFKGLIEKKPKDCIWYKGEQ